MTLLDPPVSVERPPQPKRWSGEEYDRLVDMGAFEGQHVELLDGELIQMSPMGNDHARATLKALYALMECFPKDRYVVKPQMPFELDRHSRPEPDLAVYRTPLASPADSDVHPTMIVEVSSSSLSYDRNRKLPAYAAQRIPEVWIVNLQDACVEIYRNPHAIAGGFAYAPATVLRKGDTIATLERPDTPLAIADLLP